MEWLSKIFLAILFCFAIQARAANFKADFKSNFNQIHGQNILTGEETDIAPGKKGTVIIFMSITCPCSNSHVPMIKKLADRFKEFSFVAVHSNNGEELEASKAYFKAADLPFPVLQDKKTELADAFKAYKTPHAFLVSADGKILYHGGVTNSNDAPHAEKLFLQDALDDVVNDHPVRVMEGRTLGCVISRDES